MARRRPKLELLHVLKGDAADLVAARARGVMLHRTGDIDTAGAEVEKAARTVLRRKLPGRYYVGHGHIADATWNLSPQLDVVIADTTAAPVLFRADDETEYFPYESVYAFGEVKSTYNGPQAIRGFTNSIRAVRESLKRDPTPPNYLGLDITLGAPLQLDEERPLRNPLFTFQLFVESSRFRMSRALRNLYRETPVEHLPNLVCLLDTGGVMWTHVQPRSDGLFDWEATRLWPELHQGGDHCWVLLTFGAEGQRQAAQFGLLYYTLLQAISSTFLMRPRLTQYFDSAFVLDAGQTITADQLDLNEDQR